MKTRQRNKCMMPFALLVLLLRAATTTWLSQWQHTWCPLQVQPHDAQAKMMGISSFSGIDN